MQTHEIESLHYKIYLNTKKKAQSYEARPSSLLKRYREDQEYYNQRDAALSNISELKNALFSSQIIFLGDFHTFDQNIRNAIRMMKIMIKGKKPFKLALEMLHALHQDYLEAFLSGHITEREFLELIEYHNSWKFPWTHYVPLFQLAKKYNIPIISLNIEGNLKERDEFARDILYAEMQERPSTPIFVIYGELHILPNKIPRLLKERFLAKKGFRYTLIHQHIDELYWNKKLSSSFEGIYRISPYEFCLMSAAPWLKYESMNYWYENISEDPDFDIHEYIMNTGMKTFSSEVDDNFLTLCHEIVSFFKLPLSTSDFEHFELFDYSKLTQLERKVNKLQSLPWKKFYFQLLENNRSFRFSHQDVYYCPSYSFNRLNNLVGIHLYHCLRKKQSFQNLSFFSHSSAAERFAFLTLEELCAYFFSKTLNPYKKCDLYQDIATFRGKDKKAFSLAKSIIDSEVSSIEKLLLRRNLYTLYQVAQIIGPLLGENLFLQLEKSPTPQPLLKTLKSIFSLNPSPDTFHQLKSIVLKDELFKTQQKRFF